MNPPKDQDNTLRRLDNLLPRLTELMDNALDEIRNRLSVLWKHPIFQDQDATFQVVTLSTLSLLISNLSKVGEDEREEWFDYGVFG